MSTYKLTQNTKKVYFNTNNCRKVLFNNSLVWPFHIFRFTESNLLIAKGERIYFTYDSALISNVEFRIQRTNYLSIDSVGSSYTEYCWKGLAVGTTKVTAVNIFTSEILDVITVTVVEPVVSVSGGLDGNDVFLYPNGGNRTVYHRNGYSIKDSPKPILTMLLTLSDDNKYLYFDVLDYSPTGDDNYYYIGNSLFVSVKAPYKRYVLDINKYAAYYGKADVGVMFTWGTWNNDDFYKCDQEWWTVTDIP